MGVQTRGKMKTEVSCQHCGKAFAPYSTKNVFCSEECRFAAYAPKKKAIDDRSRKIYADKRKAGWRLEKKPNTNKITDATIIMTLKDMKKGRKINDIAKDFNRTGSELARALKILKAKGELQRYINIANHKTEMPKYQSEIRRVVETRIPINAIY